MSFLCEYATAIYFTYSHIFHTFQHSAHIAYFFQHKMAFSTAILILFVFLLPNSIRFRYLDHLVANRMAPSMCLDPLERDWVDGFKQFCTTGVVVTLFNDNFVNCKAILILAIKHQQKQKTV